MPMEPGLIESGPQRGEPQIAFHVVVYAKELRLELRHGGRRYAMRKAWDETALDPMDVARYAAQTVLNTLCGIDGRRVDGDLLLIEAELFDQPRDAKEVP